MPPKTALQPIELKTARLEATQVLQSDLLALINTVPGQCAILDRQGIIRFVNAEWHQFAVTNGADARDGDGNFAVGSDYLEICEGATGACSTGAQAVAKGLRSVIRGDIDKFEYEYPCHSPDEYRWFKCISRSFPTGSKFAGLSLIQHVNVTDQVRRREAAIAQSSKLSAFIATAGAGCWSYDLFTEQLTLDETTRQLLQVGDNPIISLTQLKVHLHPEDIPLLEETLTRVSEVATQGMECDVRLIGARGERHAYSMFFVRDYTRDSAANTIQILYFNRTDQLSNVKSQEKFEYELKNLINQMPIRFSKLDSTLSYVYVNEEFVRGTGFSLEDSIGSHVSAVLGSVGWQQVRGALARTLKGERQQVELDFELPNGTRFEGIATYIPSHNHKDEIDGVYSLVQDLRELKARERDAHAARQNAERANKAKSDFFACMHHDLRTPLNAILGFSEMISSEILGEIKNKRYVEYSQDIHHSAANLLEMLNTALDFAKIEAGHITLSPERFDLGDVIDFCISMVREKAAQNDITIIDTSHLTEPVWLDRVAMKQILMNLLSNAVKFTNPGGEITVHAEQDSDRLSLSVTDTGIGMCGHEVAQMLQPFVTTANDPTTEHGGWGLGLSIIKSLVHHQNGILDIESDLDVGTTITVTLPQPVPSVDHSH